MTHTPGPWNLVNHHTVQLGMRNFVGSTNPDYPIKHSDTRLIAAAPDGLALAYAFKSYLEDDSRSERRRQACLAECNAFIAKATGNECVHEYDRLELDGKSVYVCVHCHEQGHPND